MKAASEDQLKRLLAEAVAEYYQAEDLEADQDPDARVHLLHELNQNLLAWGLLDRAAARDLEQPKRLASLIAESSAVLTVVKSHLSQCQKWAAQSPHPQGPDRKYWLEQARSLLMEGRLHDLSE